LNERREAKTEKNRENRALLVINKHNFNRPHSPPWLKMLSAACFLLFKFAPFHIHNKPVSHIVLLQPFKSLVNVIHVHHFNHRAQFLLFPELQHLLCLLHAPNETSSYWFPPCTTPTHIINIARSRKRDNNELQKSDPKSNMIT